MKLAKTYLPNEYEPTIYALWETSGAFKPTGVGEPYGVIMPPPNANANLHVGHGLDMNLKDILARYHRMKGRDVAFIPGADHAGFETWVMYEKELAKQGKSRFDFTREELYSQVWDFVEARRGDMELQLRALGTSASWEDLVFTLDEKVIKTAYDTFKKLWDDDLIYRGERIVNYCTKHRTGFADIEIKYENKKSKLWKIAYPTLDDLGEVVVATTRPETLLGDVAIAVHPNDERYKHLIGNHVLLPILKKEIPIIADEYVDIEYGTGAVKITPAHDPNDFEMAGRHNLNIKPVFNSEGVMVNVPPQFEGLTVEEARLRVLAALKAEEYLRGEEEIEHSVGHCYKCNTVIEPMIMDQWFIRMQPLAEKAIKAIEEQGITFYPSAKKAELIAYFKQLRDWNISRQIAWGIPIPAFVNENDHSDWIFDTRVDQKKIVVNGTTYIREEDTLDTWFSSGQWPFIITDVLTDGKLKQFFPLSILETGADILRAWVSRMIILSVYRTGQLPFKEVYLHGMVNDEKNQKMSKSKGNVVNPMELIAQYGSDAFRLGIIAKRSAAQPQAFSEGSVIAGRNFCNKLWNIARFTEAMVGEENITLRPEPQTLAEHWILSQIDTAAQTVEKHLEHYRFSEAAEVIYHVIWDDVADWYVEIAKTEKNSSMMAYVLGFCLRMAHPFAPFVTETIWQSLSWRNNLLTNRNWPSVREYNHISASEFTRLQKFIKEVRYVMHELPGNEKYAILYGNDTLVAENTELIAHLTKATSLERVDQPRGLRLAASGREAWLDIDEKTLYEHQSNLEVRLATLRQEIKRLEGRLSNENYVKQAPPALVEETRKQIDDKRAQEERFMYELSIIDA